MSSLTFEDVSKAYRTAGVVHPALVDVSFSIDPGDFLFVMGPSGAGKSTVLALASALQRPDHGIVRVAGRDLGRLSDASIPYLRRNLGIVFQDFKLLTDESAFANVAVALEVMGLPAAEIRERTRRRLMAVDLDPDRRTAVGCLSGGEQQRVALARALVGEPAILLADEPTGNLDPGLSREIVGHIAAERDRGTSIVLATHDPTLVELVPGAKVLRLVAGRTVDRPGDPDAGATPLVEVA